VAAVVAAVGRDIALDWVDFRNIAMSGGKKGRLTLESRLVVSICATFAIFVVFRRKYVQTMAV